MNFDFSDDLQQLRAQARRFLTEQSPPKLVRQVLEGGESYAAVLWRGMADMGWLGAAIPEQYGGAGLGYEGLCVLAEELGRVLAPVPFASSAYLATEALLLAGTEAQKRRLLPKLADGSAIGCLALAEGTGNPDPASVRARAIGGRLSGGKWPVMDGGIADFTIVVARDEAGEIALFLSDLTMVARRELTTVDPSRNHARIDFAGAEVERLGSQTGWSLVQRLLERAAIMVAFEQVGGADASLEMARNYAQERYAFGRPIGSFQAIKHKLADVYVAIELARSNAYYGAWALSADAAELPLAAATARVSATEAFHLASKENIQTHGGIGFTWDVDCHLYYRRSKQLALALGAPPWWKHRLVELIEMRNAA
ncbi:MAG TPA: acyl-CoA dehydrogenase family protein [Acetobacteraceae bacterium]|jgi:alkylation response protein AidB-like acyl-CoA dehydrogenase